LRTSVIVVEVRLNISKIFQTLCFVPKDVDSYPYVYQSWLLVRTLEYRNCPTNFCGSILYQILTKSVRTLTR